MKTLLALFTLAWVTVASAADDIVATNVVPPVETNAPVSSRDLSLSLSLPAREVVRLAEASIDESVILAFIQGSAGQFDLLAADIIYLKDLAVTPPLIAACGPATHRRSHNHHFERNRHADASKGSPLAEKCGRPFRSRAACAAVDSTTRAGARNN